MRLVFLGTPDFAVPSLTALVEAGREVAAVYVQPDRPAGRGRKPKPPPVKERALALGLDVRQPENPNSAASLGALRAAGADLFVVVAYGCILSAELLRTPHLGCINLHASLLPEFRGASPVAAALLGGRVETGVTTMWMDEGIDTGDVIHQRTVPIDPEENAGELSERLARIGAELLVETVDAIESGTAPRTPQDREAGSYARKLRKEQGALDWSRSAAELADRVRALNPWPGAFSAFESEDGRRVELRVERARPVEVAGAGGEPGSLAETDADRVLVHCGRGALELVVVKPAGRRSMPAEAWIRGLRGSRGRFVAAERLVR